LVADILGQPIGRPETSVTKYELMLGNISEGRKSHLHHGGGLQSLKKIMCFTSCPLISNFPFSLTQPSLLFHSPPSIQNAALFRARVLTHSWYNITDVISVLKMEAAGSSKTRVIIYESTLHHRLHFLHTNCNDCFPV